MFPSITQSAPATRRTCFELFTGLKLNSNRRPGLLKSFNLFLLVCVFSSLGMAQGTLNVSTDLTTLKIAAQNLVPNTPALDAGPLLAQAVAYAQRNGIRTVTAKRGNYYFLSLATNLTHFIINPMV
jgi:hypothetical protein